MMFANVLLSHNHIIKYVYNVILWLNHGQCSLTQKLCGAEQIPLNKYICSDACDISLQYIRLGVLQLLVCNNVSIYHARCMHDIHTVNQRRR